jgi:hypothetical protein
MTLPGFWGLGFRVQGSAFRVAKSVAFNPEPGTLNPEPDQLAIAIDEYSDYPQELNPLLYRLR